MKNKQKDGNCKRTKKDMNRSSQGDETFHVQSPPVFLPLSNATSCSAISSCFGEMLHSIFSFFYLTMFDMEP